MINIKGAAGLAKRAINRIVIAITNCYRTADGHGPLFIYRDICPWAGYTDVMQTAHVTIWYLVNNPQKPCGVPSGSPMHSPSDKPMCSP